MQRHNSPEINTHKLRHTLPLSLSSGLCVPCSAGSQCEPQCASLFFFPSFFFQAAISARPRHLFSMLWNTALPLAAGVFTWWQKLSIGVKKESTQDRSDSGHGLDCLSRRCEVTQWVIFLFFLVRLCVFLPRVCPNVFLFSSPFITLSRFNPRLLICRRKKQSGCWR